MSTQRTEPVPAIFSAQNGAARFVSVTTVLRASPMVLAGGMGPPKGTGTLNCRRATCCRSGWGLWENAVDVTVVTGPIAGA
jgi:hypothetical protein